jgi:hypothetical protein
MKQRARRKLAVRAKRASQSQLRARMRRIYLQHRLLFERLKDA